MDHLHIDDELIVYYKGKEALVLNKRLLDQQNAWHNLEAIKMKHVERLALEEAMDSVDSKNTALLHELDEKYTEIEFELQELWGFPKNRNYHKFWNRPKCDCATMDNNDNWPYGPYWINANCPLHGKL